MDDRAIMRQSELQMQSDYAVPTVLLLLLSALSALLDWRRHKRADRAAVGIMPWPLIMILSLIAGVMCAAYWLRDG